MSEISKEIGKQIRSFRKRRGMTLDDLSRIICKSKSTISKYERGTDSSSAACSMCCPRPPTRGIGS